MKRFSGTPFTIGCVSVENRPGTWNSTKVSIYWGETMIGEYIRNYSSHSENTFYPFMQDGQWYALYSAEYTALRCMKLHENTIEDWGGDLAKSTGFCPVEVYVPKYNTIADSYLLNGEKQIFDYYTVDTDSKADAEFIAETRLPGYMGTTYCDFGFIAGCVWGDDSSWKIQFVNLKDIANTPMEISEKFGYWEMPKSMKLRDCLDMDGWEPDHPWIRLTKSENFNLETDEKC